MKISVKNRKIGYTYLSQSGYFSFRGQKEIAFESRLEKDFLTSFAFSERVMDIDEQPFTLTYTTIEGKEAVYTPDFMVTFRPETLNPSTCDKTMIVEVKPREILKKDFCIYRERFKAMISYCRQNDMIFRIYDESRIHTDYFHNVTRIMRYRRYRYDPVERDTILDYVHTAGQVLVGMVPEIFGGTDTDKAEILGHVYHLLATKQLAADLTRPLNAQTEIWVNTNYGSEEEA
ncbi:MAG: TnsA endonuclease N-terminal domain-containing protein [Sulfurovum sp.]|nr:TnsA endonuclease N-terminal domain-containing protein [Sulfurovum sp.]